MGDILKLIDWLKDHPGVSWIPLLIAAGVLVLLYEVVKQLLPKIFQEIYLRLTANIKRANSRVKTEADMRRFCKSSRSVNWANSLPAMSRYGLNIPLQDVFILPKLALHTGTGTAQVQEIGEILSKNRILCLTGAPSSGKSTLLSFLAIVFANETAPEEMQLLESRIPICFDFKEFVDPSDVESLPELISMLYKRHGLDVDANFIVDLFKQGRCALFLDGLDESGDDKRRKRILQWIIEVMSMYPDTNRIFVTCRDFEWELSTVPGIARAVIQPFTEEDAGRYISKFKESVLSRTNSSNRKVVEEKFERLMVSDDYHFLTTSPMLLTLAVSLLTLDIPVPKRRAEILATFVRTMLRDWAVVKGMSDSAISVPDIQGKLEQLGYRSLSTVGESGALTLDDPEITETIKGDESAAASWLDEVASRTGIITRLGERHWIFSNRRILEYLGANDLGRHAERWAEHWIRPDWKEVFAFLPDVSPKPSDYVNWVEQQGPPKSQLHALFILRASMAPLSPDMKVGDRLLSMARTYVYGCQADADVTDEELLRLFIRLDWSQFARNLEGEIEGGSSQDRPLRYVTWAVRSGSQDAIRYVAARFNQLSAEKAKAILDIASPSRARISLVRAAFLSELSVSELAGAFARCGGDALAFLCSVIKSNEPRELKEKAIRLIAEFSDSNATIFLFDLFRNSGGSIVRGAITRHLNVISDKSGTNLVRILLTTKSTFYTRSGKRVFDICLSSAMLLALAPLIVALIIKLSSPGPILYLSRRPGRNGHEHIRFRTMRLSKEAPGVVSQASRRDPRVTRIGAFLRRTSLDELPVLMNVFKGDVSIVGPQLFGGLDYMDAVTSAILERFRPGLLGHSQNRYHSSGSAFFGEQHFNDLRYMADCTFLGDVRILMGSLRQRVSESSY